MERRSVSCRDCIAFRPVDVARQERICRELRQNGACLVQVQVRLWWPRLQVASVIIRSPAWMAE